MCRRKSCLYYPFFEQEEPNQSIRGWIATLDVSKGKYLESYGIFKVQRGWLVVHVYSKDRWRTLYNGKTTQTHYYRKAKIKEAVRPELFEKCIEKEWKYDQSN